MSLTLGADAAGRPLEVPPTYMHAREFPYPFSRGVLRTTPRPCLRTMPAHHAQLPLSPPVLRPVWLASGARSNGYARRHRCRRHTTHTTTRQRTL